MAETDLVEHDVMHRFLFENTDIRGEIVQLQDSFTAVLANNPYPPAVQQLLGEFLAAVGLLSGRLKFEAILTLQIRGDGPVPLVMAECSHNKSLRAVAQVAEGRETELDGLEGLISLVGKGVLALIIEPEQGQRYQSLVPLDSENLAGCLQDYFEQSEQLPTSFWLAVDLVRGRAGGLMLQAMPRQLESESEDEQSDWQTANALAQTISHDELLIIDHHTVLFRLFHELNVRMFDGEPVRFNCRCSQESCGNALISLGRDEVEQILAEQDQIAITCQFCNQRYSFDSQDLDTLFGTRAGNLH